MIYHVQIQMDMESLEWIQTNVFRISSQLLHELFRYHIKLFSSYEKQENMNFCKIHKSASFFLFIFVFSGIHHPGHFFAIGHDARSTDSMARSPVIRDCDLWRS